MAEIYERAMQLHEERKRKLGGASFAEAERDTLIEVVREVQSIDDIKRVLLYLLEKH